MCICVAPRSCPECEGWTKEELSVDDESVLLKDVPKDTAFVDIGFESTKCEVLKHYGLIFSGFDELGESKQVYDIVHIGNLVDGGIRLFDERDYKYREVSSRAGDIVRCVFVP